MEASADQNMSPTLQEFRILLLGSRWSGKSASANTILGRERFESGRIRTNQCEVRREVVEGRKLILFDTPGWHSSFSLTEIPESDKLKFRLNASKCQPGPNAFLLVIAIDTSFKADQKKTVNEHMKLLGEAAWKHTMVLFTYGDFLGDKTIEQHIESEGDALKWVVEKCRNRYHVFNNKDRNNSSQVSMLLEKIDQMVQCNNGGHYHVDEHIMKIIETRQREVAARAEERWRVAEEQNQQMRALISAELIKSIENLQVVLLGSRSSGKTSVLNTLLGFKKQDNSPKIMDSVAHQAFVGEQEVTLVDTPGWVKSFSAIDTPEAIKDEVMRSVFLCTPGPHVFLLVVDAAASFSAKHKNAVTTHLELLGEAVWSHTIVVFTRGDWLGSHTIEQYIEGEGEALQSLVEQCGNRYHVLDNKNASDATQVTELLHKIRWMVTENDGKHFTTDKQIIALIDDRRRKVEEGALLRRHRVSQRMEACKDSPNKLRELKIAMLGQRSFGKTAAANIILHKDVFTTRETEQCYVEVANVAGRLVTVADSPGWSRKSMKNTEETDRKVVQSLLLSTAGVHVVLLVIPLDQKFRQAHRVVLEEYMDLFNDSIWAHAMVLFTHGDRLADKSIEAHIERENQALSGLVDKCDNRYHVLNNMNKNDITQVTELFEKIEEMVAGNNGRSFCPNMRDVHLRVKVNSSRRLLNHEMRQEVIRKQLEWMTAFRDFLLILQTDLQRSASKTQPKLQAVGIPKLKVKIGLKKKDEKEETLYTKISQKIDNLNEEIWRSSSHLSSSKEFMPPEMSDTSDRLCEWLANLQCSTDLDHQKTLNYSATSGYKSDIHDITDWDNS